MAEGKGGKKMSLVGIKMFSVQGIKEPCSYVGSLSIYQLWRGGSPISKTMLLEWKLWFLLNVWIVSSLRGVASQKQKKGTSTVLAEIFCIWHEVFRLQKPSNIKAYWMLMISCLSTIILCVRLMKCFTNT